MGSTKLISIFFLSFFSISTFADLSGDWIGQGYWTFEGSGTKCIYKMSFEESENSLIRKSGSVDCDVVGSVMEVLKLLKVNGQLIHAETNQVMGSYSQNNYTIIEEYSESIYMVSKIKVNNTHFDYEEKWFDRNRSELYFLYGRLFTSR